MLDIAAWAAFTILLPILWLSGVRLFLRSGLTRRKRILWSVTLVALGVVAGFVLSLSGIRDRFLLLLVALPLIALADVKLARSHRGFAFWFRACSFEVCTVFAAATVTRLALNFR